MAYLLGIDLGTSSLKSLIMSPTGQTLALSARTYQFDIPVGGSAEQWPQVWWDACCETCREVIAKAGIGPGEISAIGFSGQMHGTVLLDAQKQPLRPAILHCDARTAAQNARIKQVLEAERIARQLMNPIYSGFMLPSLLWVRDHEPAAYDAVGYAMLPKDYLRWRMTGNIATEFSDASATLLFDMARGTWAEDLLHTFKIDPSILPEIHETTQLAGKLTAQAAEALGLLPGTPVCYGGGDQMMQAIGNGVIDESGATINVGSSAQVCFPVQRLLYNPANNMNFFGGYRKDLWIAMAATINGGLCYRWITQLLREADWDALNERVARIAPGCDGLVFLPYLGGERSPHMNPDLSGSFVGLNYATDRDHLARAVMEGVTYALYECYSLCRSLGLDAARMVASGGGAQSAVWLQMQADVFGKTLVRTVGTEQASVGAAIAAGVCAGIYSDVAEGCRAAVTYRDQITVPDLKRHSAYMEYFAIYRRLLRSQQADIELLTQMGRGQHGFASQES